LAASFTLEYAAQFDGLLPGFAALNLPILLGGSSNHFPTALLRKIGAWDPYNVTEDADLGIRLARLGYHTATIVSTTYEEAPTGIKPWLRQRTRWFKGWMKTYMVHMRQPRRLFRELGVTGFASFHFVLAGTVLSALVQPILLLMLIAALLAGTSFLASPAGALGHGLLWAHGCALAGGYLTTMIVAVIGLKRRGLLSIVWVLLLMPMQWCLLSVAAWRALIQLMFDPYRWEKTEHGLARTSRHGNAPVRDTGEDRPPLLRVAA
jgi:cellulose synthase/poly-beta-1,6-N-acetylglucosamine synthase-like glycosyltransferase